jgi:hypothetical protein
MEISGIAIEMLERQKVPVGSLILLCSASHLNNVGTTIYAIDWNNCVAELTSKIKNVKILPLVPILREDGPGSLGRQLIELRTWYARIYDKNTLGICPVWDTLIKTLTKTDEDGLDLGYSEIYSVALPISLDPRSPLEPIKFNTSSSHTTVRAFDSAASYELVRTLVDLLHSKFATAANSEDFLLFREPATQESGGKDFTKCILIGGSNLRKISPHLAEKEITVLDLTVPGWTPTAKNIQTVCDTMKTIPDISDYVVIIDGLGNITFRQEQLDGTLALPHKVGGVYHLVGQVKVCTHSSLKTMITSLKPILDMIQGEFLFLSPLPRHLFNGCCLDNDHCVGTDSKDYVEGLLKDVLSLRSVCKNALLELGKNHFWVPDLLGNALPACKGIPEIAAGLREISAADGVHFTAHGYEKITDSIVKCVHTLLEKSNTAKNSVSDCTGRPENSHGRGQKSFYWRGFVSPVGSERPRNNHAAYMLTHQGSGGRGGGKWPPQYGNVNRGRGGHNRPPFYRKNLFGMIHSRYFSSFFLYDPVISSLLF